MTPFLRWQMDVLWMVEDGNGRPLSWIEASTPAIQRCKAHSTIRQSASLIHQQPQRRRHPLAFGLHFQSFNTFQPFSFLLWSSFADDAPFSAVIFPFLLKKVR
jgi:hypothetical protein